MTKATWIYLFVIYLAVYQLSGVGAAKAKKYNQELKQRTSGQPLSTSGNKAPSKAPSTDPNSNPSNPINPDVGYDEDAYMDDAKVANTCPPCAVTKHVTRYSINRLY